MKITFNSQLEGIDWIADHTEDETQFEILREALLYNYIYVGTYFLELDREMNDVLDRVFANTRTDN